jgi:hypothetical protein
VAEWLRDEFRNRDVPNDGWLDRLLDHA